MRQLYYDVMYVFSLERVRAILDTIFVVWRDRSTNCATTAAQLIIPSLDIFVFCRPKMLFQSVCHLFVML